MNLESMTRSNADAAASLRLEASKKLILNLGNEIRTMSYRLHPPLLDEAGWSGALGWYAGGFQQRSQELKIDLQILSTLGRFSEEMELAIFRIVQKCLTNIHRHLRSRHGEG